MGDTRTAGAKVVLVGQTPVIDFTDLTVQRQKIKQNSQTEQATCQQIDDPGPNLAHEEPVYP